jgi:hypothetical protein
LRNASWVASGWAAGLSAGDGGVGKALVTAGGDCAGSVARAAFVSSARKGAVAIAATTANASQRIIHMLLMPDEH